MVSAPALLLRLLRECSAEMLRRILLLRLLRERFTQILRRSAAYPADAQQFSDAKERMQKVIDDLLRMFPYVRSVHFREVEQQAAHDGD